ncbi:MAG: HAD-IIA family hydrolase [Thaumarchaeota archaeon]|nr:HAD-IIA family hydrolase [Nitrososphaerota archaeon]
MVRMKNYRGLILDLDGCVYVGSEPTEGAVDALTKLKKLGVKILYVTNNPMRTSEEFAEKLRSMGIDCEAEEVLTVSEAVAAYIRSRSGPSKVLVIAGRGVKEYCRRFGHELLEPSEWRKAEYVVVGMDPEINYEKFRFGLKAIHKGAVFIGTNPDVTHPGAEGIEPGSGAIVAAFKAMAGFEPIIVGKPSRIIMDVALKKLGLEASEVLVVGDRLDTDIKAGKAIGADTALVLTGIAKESDLRGIPEELKPTYVFRNLGELVETLYP